ncbi:MAG: JAB domain-containing protein [Cyclobacteriaceae bacterium]
MNVSIPKDEKTNLSDSDDVYRIMQKILLRQNKLRRKREYFWTIGLSTANDIEYIELVAIGKLNTVNIDPVETFSFAVSKKCKKLILCHNHPSEVLKPSLNDKDTTSRMVDAGHILGIEIVEHLIINENQFFSFSNNDLLR